MSGNGSDRIMTIREVAEYLQLASSTVYKLAQEGVLPARKIGGTWRFSLERLDRWIQSSSPDVEDGDEVED
ncbi:MAG: helix-turn-helix domain-containing protein [Anaerolineales bacterium]|nr:helix-turn-helix domain-containing protein [Anaerolineales bacterium]MCB8952885.1 helix-turn-helix domain-containing protein [Ardenticatenales bacterium]